MLAVGDGDVCGTGGKTGAGELGKDPCGAGVPIVGGGGGGGLFCFLLKSWQPRPHQNKSSPAAIRHFLLNGIIGLISSSTHLGKSAPRQPD